MQTVVVKQCRQAYSEGSVGTSTSMLKSPTISRLPVVMLLQCSSRSENCWKKECISKFILPVRGRTVEADELQTVLMKADRQVGQFKGKSVAKGKVGGGGEVRTQRLVHD